MIFRTNYLVILIFYNLFRMINSSIFKGRVFLVLALLNLIPFATSAFQSHPNDSLSTAYEITLDTTGHYFSDISEFTVLGASGDGIKYSNWLYTPEKNIWFKFVAPTSDTLSISIELSSSGQYGDLIQAAVTDSLGVEMGSKHWVNAANTTTPKEIFINNLQAGNTYYLNVDIPYPEITSAKNFTLRFQNYIDSACIDTYTEYVGIDGGFNVEINSLIDSGCSWPCPSGNCTKTVFFPALGSSEFDLGKNYVTIQGVDDNDSTYYGTAIVNLADTIPPTLVTKNIVRYTTRTQSSNVSPSSLVKYYSSGTSSPAPNPVPGDGMEVFEYWSAYTKDNVALGGASISKSSFTCNDAGENEVTVTIWDTSGNETTGTAIVYVVDNTQPVAQAKDITVYLDNDGIAQVNPQWADNGSTAGCSGSDFISSLNKSIFDKNDLGINSITYIIEDSNSNVDTDIININVVDTISPVVFPLSKQIVLDESGNYTLTYDELMNPCENVTIPDPNAGGGGWVPDGSVPFFSPPTYSFDYAGCTYDNAEITDTSMSKTDFTTSDLGMNQVTITVTDQSGNFTEVIANINVVSAASCVTELWAIASGNWNDPSIWSATEGGAPLSVIPCNITNVHFKDYNVEISSHITANKVYITNSNPEVTSGLKVISGGLDVVEKIDIQGVGALVEGKPGTRLRVLQDF